MYPMDLLQELKASPVSANDPRTLEVCPGRPGNRSKNLHLSRPAQRTPGVAQGLFTEVLISIALPSPDLAPPTSPGRGHPFRKEGASDFYSPDSEMTDSCPEPSALSITRRGHSGSGRQASHPALHWDVWRLPTQEHAHPFQVLEVHISQTSASTSEMMRVAESSGPPVKSNRPDQRHHLPTHRERVSVI